MNENVYTIEDCLELLTGLKSQATFQIESSDVNFLQSIARQVFKGTALTDRQYDAVKEKSGAITPVPGGVGPMTRYGLLYNTLKSFKKKHNIT